MLKDKKILFYLLVILYLGIGIYLSITTGITSDESFEQLNWDKNVLGIISLLKFGHYDEFLRYLDKYHGIAFHYISQPIQFFISNLVSNLNEVSDYGGHLMSKHSIVFLIFSLSGIYFFRLINKITQNLFFSYLSTSNFPFGVSVEIICVPLFLIVCPYHFKPERSGLTKSISF